MDEIIVKGVNSEAGLWYKTDPWLFEIRLFGRHRHILRIPPNIKQLEHLLRSLLVLSLLTPGGTGEGSVAGVEFPNIRLWIYTNTAIVRVNNTIPQKPQVLSIP